MAIRGRGFRGTTAGRQYYQRRAQRPAAVQQAERDYLRELGPTNTGISSGGMLSPGNYRGWMQAAAGANAAPVAPAGPGFMGGGGGGGRGGGGGGGGGAAMTQAMFDQMLRALGAGGPQLQLQQQAMPAFRGTNLAAFDPTMFNNMRNQLTQAVTADQAAAQQGATQATQALQGNYTNAYGNTQVQGAPAAQQVGAGLQATAGGGGDQAAIAAQSNQAAGQDQAGFQNLLNILGAADQSAQASRLNQVELDKQTALRNIGAQRTGLGAGIGMAQGRAQQDWAARDAERRYQNSLMQQQWQREALMRNQDVRNQGAQANWQQRNEMISSRMQPLLELLGSTAGTNINAAGLQQLLAGWGR